MQTYEITTTAHSTIRETWRVKARDEAHARMLFERGEAEFVGDRVTGDATQRAVVSVEPTDAAMPTDPKPVEPERPEPINLAAVRFVRDVATALDAPADLKERARRIAERLA